MGFCPRFHPLFRAATRYLKAPLGAPETREVDSITQASVSGTAASVTFPQRGGYAGEAVPGFTIDFSGARFRQAFDVKLPAQAGYLTFANPVVDKEFYEWSDLICAIEAARQRDKFTFAEFGAGYGRWSIRAYLLARRAGISQVRTLLVEAEPQHLRWLYQSLRDNRIPRRAATIFWAAVCPTRGTHLFYIDKPDEAGSGLPNHWYGQALVHEWEKVAAKRSRFGRLCSKLQIIRKSVALESGWRAISVPAVRLRDVVPRGEVVDLADFDVQGVELEVIRESIDILNETFRMVHIATHTAAVEIGLRDLLSLNGWILVRDLPLGWHGVEAGKPVELLDGVQTWLNPRLIQRPPEHYHPVP